MQWIEGIYSHSIDTKEILTAALCTMSSNSDIGHKRHLERIHYPLLYFPLDYMIMRIYGKAKVFCV